MMGRFSEGMRMWLADGGRYLELSVRSLPLVFGAMVTNGPALKNQESFVMLMAILLGSTALSYVREEFPHTQKRGVFMSLLTIGVLILAGAWHNHAGEQRLPVLLFVIFALSDQLAGFSHPAKSIFSLTAQAIGLLLACSTLAVLAVFSQSGQLIWGTAILGFIPASILFAARLARHFPSLSNLGLSTSTSENNRLQGASMLYALTLMTGPALAVILAACQQLPQTFLLSPLILIRTGAMVGDLSTAPDKSESVALKTCLLAGLSSLLMLGLGLL